MRPRLTALQHCLSPGTTVNVTFLPGSDPMETVAVAKRLHNEGMNAVPHLAARSLKDLDQIDTLLASYRAEAGVDEVLIIGGGVDQPVGAFDNSLQILETGFLQKHGIRRVGVAGHPEGSPDISQIEIAEALGAKNALAKREGLEMYIETQFCFEAPIVLEWEKSVRAAGNELPIRIGIPGPATIKTLFRFAQISGIGPSMRFISKQARNVAKLMTVQSPHLLLSDLAQKAWQMTLIALLSIFTFIRLGALRRPQFTQMQSHPVAFSFCRRVALTLSILRPKGAAFWRISDD